MKQKPKALKNFGNYILVAAFFVLMTVLGNAGLISRSLKSMLIPICCYMVMTIALNLCTGILGELSLGHAGFMSIGAYSGIIVAMTLINAGVSDGIALAAAMVSGAVFGAIGGFIVGIPTLRLQGDYLAIVTLAFGEIIKELATCLLVGCDSNGLHFIFNGKGTKTLDDLNLAEDGFAIIKGAQGATGTKTISTFAAGIILLFITLFVVQNLVNSKSGRAIMALRDNRIAAESIGINITKYKMMAFVVSTAIAGAAGALYGLNFSNLVATKFDFNTSILILVFLVLGGLGNLTGSMLAAAALTILPEILRGMEKYRMLIYAVILIFVMIFSNSPQVKEFRQKLSMNFTLRKGGKRNGTE